MKKIDNGYIDILHESQTYDYAKKGWFDDLEVGGIKMKVYNIWVQTLLFWGTIHEDEKFKEIQIDSEYYKKSYKEGYIKGQKYFIKYFKDNPSNSTIKSLIHKILNKNKEVAKVINTNECILNKEVFEKYGYNSGIYFEMKKYEKENIHDFHEVLNNGISKSSINHKKNHHPSIFEDGAFQIFKKWMTLSKEEDSNKKLSFIFQKLKSENKLRKTNFKDLLEWSKDNKYIKEPVYQAMLEIGSFHSPSKILTKRRLETFDIILSD